MTECCGKHMYITGGNDGCVAVWDVGEINDEANGVESTNNGIMARERLSSSTNPP